MRDRGKVIKQIVLDVLKGVCLGLTFIGAMLLIGLLLADPTNIGSTPGDPEWISQLPAAFTHLRRGLLIIVAICAIGYPVLHAVFSRYLPPEKGKRK